jgi:hypothetical protein
MDVIRHLLEGQYSNPVRIVGFNTAEGWSRDVSEDVAKELRSRCDAEGPRRAGLRPRFRRAVRGQKSPRRRAWRRGLNVGASRLPSQCHCAMPPFWPFGSGRAHVISPA